MSGLIDTTEMYLRTIFELEEEGVVPLRARIAERLSQSGPTVSQTVARMERDGLVTVEGDRHLELSATGRPLAMRVMRRHRLAECLLVEVIGVPWEEAHAEACRWEHVMSEPVERRVLKLLDYPTTSPFGNPIPGLTELGRDNSQPTLGAVRPLGDFVGNAPESPVLVLVQWIGEPLQTQTRLLSTLRRCGIRPGETVKAEPSPGGVLVGSGGEYAELSPVAANQIWIDGGPRVS